MNNCMWFESLETVIYTDGKQYCLLDQNFLPFAFSAWI